MKFGLDTLLPAHLTVNTRRPAVRLGSGVRLARGRIHEVIGPAADMFAVLAGASHGADVIWMGLGRDIDTLCPAGFQPFLDPARLILVQGVSRGELLWGAEQALRAEGAFAVVLDMPDALSFRESRRLQLAAETGGGLGIIRVHAAPSTSAAQTRWHCAPVCSDAPSWVWRCLKGKSGEAGAWKVSCEGGRHAKDTLHMVPAAAA